MENSNSLGGARIALLIDFDNVILGIDDPGFDVELVVNALRERGTIVVSRVYGDWYRHSRHRRHLMEHGLELVEAPAFGPVIKNSADIKIALDGLELGMTQPHINTFCLVSGDSDFLPLIKKLQGLGKNVLVICGNRFTSDMLRRNCNEFISYENLLAASYGADEDATTLDGAFALLHRAMAALRERGSEIRTSTLKQMMIQLNPVFSEKTFGYHQFRGFLDKAGREHLIKLGPRDRVSGEFYVLLPEEDEAEVIEKSERAEPAEMVEEIVESRRSNGRNRRREDSRNEKIKEDAKEQRDVAASDDEPQRPRSRREARLMAHREQTAAQQNETAPIAAPVATPLTSATDFSPADARETKEMSLSRQELLSRGLRVGKFKFSAAKGVEKIAAPTETEIAPVEADIALAPEDVTPEVVTPEESAPKIVETENSENGAPDVTTEAEEKPKRSRSRRRKKTAAQESEPAQSETVEIMATATEVEEVAAPEADSTATTEQSAETTPAAETETAPAETQTRRCTRSRAKAKPEAKPATETETPAQDASGETPVGAAKEETIAPEKPKRTRRSKKTEIPKNSTETEKAVQADGTEQTVSTQALIDASADTPAAEAKPKAKRRRTTRKNAEETAEAKAEISQNIVTSDQTTGEVSPEQLAQIPVPASEDEL